MIIFLVLLGVLCLWGMKFTGFREDYLSKRQTDSLKGIFAFLIYMSHVRAHIPLNGTADMLYSAVFTRLGQMTVVPFLFYSGYSIIWNIQNKPKYMEGFLQNRIAKLLLDFNLVVIVYGVYNCCKGVVFPIESYLLAWCGWKSLIGGGFEDVWYIFDVFLLYTATFAAYWCVLRHFTKRHHENLLPFFAIVFLFSIGLVVTLSLFGKDEYWYNTLMAYSFGMLYGIYKQNIDNILQRNWVYFVAIFGVCIGAGVILASGRKDVICYSLMSILFVLFVTLITMHVRIQNSVLSRIGKLSFGIYIHQRLIMFILSHLGLNHYPVLFTFLCMGLTIIASLLHRLIADKISNILFSPKKKKYKDCAVTVIK